MSFLHKIHNVAHAVGEYVTPVLQTSAFKERGVLTPEEFVQAGDQLVRTCPTWEWASGDPAKRRSFLPEDKQFLITRGVTCEHRVRALEANYSAEVEMEGGEGEDTWLATHNNRVATGSDAAADAGGVVDLTDLGAALPSGANAAATPAPAPAPAPGAAAAAAADQAPAATADASAASEQPKADENEDGFIDIDDFVEDDLDNSAAVAATAGAEGQDGAAADDDMDRMRTYDLSITYDKFYQTPRVWLYGYDDSQRPLSGKEVLEDIMQDYANKTVTIEPHPQLPGGVSYASIHPCKHADVMKKIVAHLTDSGKGADPSQYLFMFLKFIQSVIPTINYDNTIEVEAM